MHPFHLSSSPRGIAHLLGAIIALLLCAHAVGLVLRLGLDHDYVYGLVPLFDVDVERNIPTFFSVCLGLCSALLLAIVGLDARNRGSRDAIYWFVLACGFLFIAYDEGFQVHEKLSAPMRAAMGGSDPANGEHLGIFFHGWVVPGMIGVAIAALLFLKFLARLPSATRRSMLFAAALFLGGCLGMELINGKVLELQGESVLYNLLVLAEEGLEMSGLAALIHALTRHIAAACDRLQLDLHADERAPQVATTREFKMTT